MNLRVALSLVAFLVVARPTAAHAEDLSLVDIFMETEGHGGRAVVEAPIAPPAPASMPPGDDLGPGDPGRGTPDPNADASSPSEDGVSLGEGGRDLATRIHLRSIGASVEMHAGAGIDGAAFGIGTVHYRVKPLFLMHRDVAARIAVFGGAGVGAAWVMHGRCGNGSLGACDVEQHERGAATATVQVGARVRTEAAPVVTTFEVDTAESHGTTATFSFAMELGEGVHF